MMMKKWCAVVMVGALMLCCTCEASWAKTSDGKYYEIPDAGSAASTTQAESYSSQQQQDMGQTYYQVIMRHIYRTSPYLGMDWADSVARCILSSCVKYQVDPLLATALFTQESGFNNSAVSSTGAIGISQLMPSTAESLGVNPQSPAENIDGGVKYLSYQLQQFQSAGEWCFTYAIAAYNAGPGRIFQYGGVPPYQETINHVRSIGAIYTRLVSDMSA